MDFETRLHDALELTASLDLLREPPAFVPAGCHLRSAETRWVSFASNDYLGLAEASSLQNAVASAALHRVGGTSSRVVVGTSPAHRDAEAALAEFVGLPSARVFSSAYSANVGLLGSLFQAGDLLLSDSLNHASLIDGCRLSRARVEVYRHGDLDHLLHLVRTYAPTARVAAIVTESAFSMDGDLADLIALARLAQEHRLALIVDEAHALGVIGPSGRGLCAELGVRADVVIGGLGKAFGLGGGFLTGSTTLGRAIDNFVRTYVFSTAILPPIAAAIPLAVDLLRGADAERIRLASHAARIRATSVELARPVLGRAPAAIVPVVLGGADEAVRTSEALRQLGLFVPAMRPPTVPIGTSRLRITPTAGHSEAEISMLCDGLRRVLGSPSKRDDERQGDQT